MNDLMLRLLTPIKFDDIEFREGKAPHSKRNSIEKTRAIFEEMGYGQDEVMRMSFETHSESFWRSENFFSMVIENLAEMKGGVIDTICYSFSGELPARISQLGGSFSPIKKAEILSRLDFDITKQWQRYLLRELGLSPEASLPEKKPRYGNPRIIQTSSSMPELYDYQVEIKDRILRLMSADSPVRAVVPMPTGSGKTRVTVEAMMEKAQSSGSGLRAIWVADRKELCGQALDTVTNIFEDLGRRSPRPRFDEMTIVEFFDAQLDESKFVGQSTEFNEITIFVATPDQLEQRFGEPSFEWIKDNADMIVIDEAHLGRDEWERAIGPIRDCHTILLSATPQPVLDDVDDWIYPVDTLDTDNVDFIEALQDGGYLSEQIDDKEYRVDAMMSGIGKSSEYNRFQGSNIDSPFWYLAMREMARREFTRGSYVLVFVDEVVQARRLASIISNDQGSELSCYAFWGKMDRDERKRRADKFRAGDVNMLVSVKLLTTGFDAPNVNSVVIARSSIDRTTSIWTQMVGRGLRGPKMGGGSKYCSIFTVR